MYDGGMDELAVNSSTPRSVLTIGEVAFDPARRRLLRDGREFELEPKVCELFLHLLRNESVVSRDDLLDTLWGIEGSDEALTQTVSKLRRALGDVTRPYRIIQTIPKRGYQLVARPSIADFTNGDGMTSRTPALWLSLQEHILKRADYYRGAVIGAVVISLGFAVLTILQKPKSIEQEIDCPDHWQVEECMRLIEKIQP